MVVALRVGTALDEMTTAVALLLGNTMIAMVAALPLAVVLVVVLLMIMLHLALAMQKILTTLVDLLRPVVAVLRMRIRMRMDMEVVDHLTQVAHLLLAVGAQVDVRHTKVAMTAPVTGEYSISPPLSLSAQTLSLSWNCHALLCY
jgi:hypothetical protein